MKKFRILMGALALAVVVFFIIACNKEKAEVKTFAEAEIISKEDDMSAYLKQFKEKMQSAAKGDETLSMEDARWHLEAVLNYTYGDAGHQTSDIQCDTFCFVLHTDGDEVTLAQLNEAFEALSYDVEKAYGNCNLPDKSVLAIQTSFEDESKDGDVVVRSILSMRGLSSVTNNMWFDSTDYWDEDYYDYGDGSIIAGGKCGPYAGDCLESGAPWELTKKLRLRMPVFSCVQGGGYFTDYEHIELSIYADAFYNINIDFLGDENSPCGYKLYCRPSSEYSTCICPEDMNYYLSKGPELVEYYRPEGKEIVEVYYQSGEIVGVIRDSNCFHELIMKYGVFHCGGNGGGGLDD